MTSPGLGTLFFALFGGGGVGEGAMAPAMGLAMGHCGIEYRGGVLEVSRRSARGECRASARVDTVTSAKAKSV